MRVSRQLLILFAILLLGALLRGLYLNEIVHRPDFTNPGVDAGYHDYWARGIATGNWIPPQPFDDPMIRTTAYFRPPGYSYFMAGIYLLTGNSYLGLRIAQMLIGLLSCCLAFVLGRRWFGGRVGLIFAALMSVYWVFIYFEGELLEPILLVALGLLLFNEASLWVDKVSPVRALYSGVILGLFALVRPNILLFAPAALLWLAWIAHYRKDFRLLRTAALGLLVGSVLTIAPVTIRNWVVAHEFVPISTNTGINLLIGNNRYANGFCVGAVPGLGRFETCYDYPQIVRNLETKTGRRMTHTEVSDYFSRQAKDYIRTHPGEFMRLNWKRALLFWGPKEVGHNKEDEMERANSTVLRIIPVKFPLVLALCLVGVGLLLADTRKRIRQKDPATRQQYEVLVLAALFVLTYFVSYVPFFVAGRYRVPIVPIMMLPAAYGIERIIRFFSTRRFVPALISVALIGGAYALASLNPTGYSPDAAKWHYDKGIDYAAAGDLKRAVEQYRKALEEKPGFPQAHGNLAFALMELGRIDDAIDHFNESLRLEPTESIPHYGLGLAYTKLGRAGDAVREFKEAIRNDPRHAPSYHELGLALINQGRNAEAKSLFEKALRIRPNMAESHTALGIIFQGSGRFDEAVEHFKASIEIKPEPIAYFRLANILAHRGKLDEAIEHYGRAIRLRPDYSEAHYEMGIALSARSRLDEAIEQYRKAVELAPNYAKAHKNLAVALYFKGDYAGAWNEVNLAKKNGAQIPPDFIQALKEKMPEPR